MAPGPTVRHEDIGRWFRFPFREGDIVIAHSSKSGTTLMQMYLLRASDLPDRGAHKLPDLRPGWTVC